MKSHVEDLFRKVNGCNSQARVDRLALLAKAQGPVLIWVQHFMETAGDRPARELLSGARAACVETMTYCTLGLGRAAITAVRTQVDLVLAYTYFRDHPMEWRRVQDVGEGFMLRGDIDKYLRDMDAKLAVRFNLLEGVLGRRQLQTLVALYRTMSAHVHGQSPLTVPSASQLTSLVCDDAYLDAVVELQLKVGKALSYYLVAVYAPHWADLPKSEVDEVKALFAKADVIQKFFT